MPPAGKLKKSEFIHPSGFTLAQLASVSKNSTINGSEPPVKDAIVVGVTTFGAIQVFVEDKPLHAGKPEVGCTYTRTQHGELFTTSIVYCELP
ncbi:MAG: hypothetical protein Salg2KO_21370 [Salibacteraceae bacterium]